MSSFSSYPRTDLPSDLYDIPPGAYANIPEPLRSKIIAKTAKYRTGFKSRFPHLDFLMPAYLDPSTFKDLFREDNVGRDTYPELGATKGTMPILPPGTLNPAIDRTANPQIEWIDERFRSTFLGVIELASTLSDDTILWRFVGANYTDVVNGAPEERYTCNKLGGIFWGVGSVPTTEADWRRFYAIPGIWNGDGGYVALRLGDLPPNIRACFRRGLVGMVATQPSMLPGYFLEGGGRQLAAPKHIFDFEPFFNVLKVHRSAWNS